MTESLTACVIARDEEQRLPACLETLAFCDEVIVVDGGSRDRTCEIARAAGARVIENPWPGFPKQRNVAIDNASGDWVLEVDADERVTPQLATEVGRLLQDPPNELTIVAIPMRDVFLGRPLGPSVRYPRFRHRLFRRGSYRHDESRAVHEGLWGEGPVLALEGELEHVLASTWREALADARAYARLEGTQRSRPGAVEALSGILLRPAAKFAYRVFLYGGWRDGWRGVLKISLECGGDSLATLHRLRHGARGGRSGLGQEPPRLGPVRLVGIAFSRAAAERLDAWLATARAGGADVVLICTDPVGGGRVRRRLLKGAWPEEVVRAIDAEDQLRPIDALVPAGPRERLLARAAPRAICGAHPPLDPGLPAVDSVDQVRRHARPREPA